jgi:outer membrane protein TolC
LIEQNSFFYEKILKQEKLKKTLVSRNDKIDTEIAYQRTLNQLRNIQNKLKQAEYEFSLLTGEVPEKLSLEKINFPNLDELEVLKRIDNNPAVKSAYYQYRARKHGVKSAAGNFSPKAYFVATKQNQENMVYLGGEDLKSESYYLKVSIPLFQKGNEYFDFKKSKYEALMKREEYRVMKEKVAAEVNKKFSEYRFSLMNFSNNEELFELVNEKYNRNKNNFKLQAIDVINLLKSQIERNEVWVEKINARSELYIKYFALQTLIAKNTKSIFKTHE